MNATFSELLKNIERPSPLQSFTDPIDSIQVIVHKSREDRTIEVSGIAPFHTVEDLHRAIWMAEDKDDDFQNTVIWLLKMVTKWFLQLESLEI